MNSSVTVELQWGQFAERGKHQLLLKRAWVKKLVLHGLACGGEITVRIVGEAEGRALNLQYRGKDYATNVLTFDYQQRPVVMADFVLCAPIVAKEAMAQNKPLKNHYAHLIIHATLHAQGYDHEGSDRQAFEMEALEVLLLGALGYANPY